MVEFTGQLTGRAEKCFIRKSRRTGLSFVGFGCVLTVPFVVFISKAVFHDDLFMYMMIPALCMLPLLCLIPKSKKEHLAMLPKRIYLNKNHVVCVADRYSESKLIQDVAKVIDHGEFYELRFPFGKLSEKFICQKKLLSKGSIEEFERLFAGKIVKR